MTLVVIVSHEKDEHARLVRKRLKALGAKVALIDFGRYPDTESIGLLLSSNGDRSGEVTFKLKGVTPFKGSSVKSVWWRRPKGGVSDKSDNLLSHYINTESEMLTYSLEPLMSDAQWISTPDATRQANRKPYQLSIAASVGLQIPETCIGNSWSVIADWLRDIGDMRLIIKPVGSAFVRLNRQAADKSGKNKVLYTHLVDKESLRENKDLVQNCPIILQEAIVSDFDVRVTVVGKKCFASAIRTTGVSSDPACLDWRNLDLKRHYEKHQLPRAVAHRCIELTERLGLKFGCIDLGFSNKRGHFFFPHPGFRQLHRHHLR